MSASVKVSFSFLSHSTPASRTAAWKVLNGCDVQCTASRYALSTYLRYQRFKPALKTLHW